MRASWIRSLAALAAKWRKPWTARARDEREPLKRTVWTLSAAASSTKRRRKNNEIKIGNQLYMAFVPVLSLRAALPGAARAHTSGRVHAALGRKPDAPPGGCTPVTAA